VVGFWTVQFIYCLSCDEKLFELVIDVFSTVNMNIAVLWIRDTLRFLAVYRHFRGS